MPQCPSQVDDALGHLSPKELVSEAGKAAEQGEEFKCASLLWTLKRLDR